MLVRSTLILAAFAVANGAAAEGTRGLPAHAHGHVTLQIAIEGGAVALILEAPAADIIGFEHAPETDDQRAMIEAAREILSDPATLFVFPAEAGCAGVPVEVTLHREGAHAAFEAEYALTCADASAITAFETRIFDLYPTVEEIDVEYVTPLGQGAGDLSPGTALALPSS